MTNIISSGSFETPQNGTQSPVGWHQNNLPSLRPSRSLGQPVVEITSTKKPRRQDSNRWVVSVRNRKRIRFREQRNEPSTLQWTALQYAALQQAILQSVTLRRHDLRWVEIRRAGTRKGELRLSKRRRTELLAAELWQVELQWNELRQAVRQLEELVATHWLRRCGPIGETIHEAFRFIKVGTEFLLWIVTGDIPEPQSQDVPLSLLCPVCTYGGGIHLDVAQLQPEPKLQRPPAILQQRVVDQQLQVATRKWHVVKKSELGLKPDQDMAQPAFVQARDIGHTPQEFILHSDPSKASNILGKVGVTIWKQGAGRRKSWKSCPGEKIRTRRHRHRDREELSHRQICRRHEQSTTLSEPILMLKRNKNFAPTPRTREKRPSRQKKERHNKNHSGEVGNEFDFYEPYLPPPKEHRLDYPKSVNSYSRSHRSKGRRDVRAEPLTGNGNYVLSTIFKNPLPVFLSQVPAWLQVHTRRCEIILRASLSLRPSPSHNRRGVRGLTIPKFETFQELHNLLVRSGDRLGEKCDKVMGIVLGKLSGDEGDVIKLCKVINKWKNQLDLLKPAYSIGSRIQDRIQKDYAKALQEIDQLRLHAINCSLREDDLADEPWMLRKKPGIGTRLKQGVMVLPHCPVLQRSGILDLDVVDSYSANEILAYSKWGLESWKSKQDLQLNNYVRQCFAAGNAH